MKLSLYFVTYLKMFNSNTTFVHYFEHNGIQLLQHLVSISEIPQRT